MRVVGGGGGVEKAETHGGVGLRIKCRKRNKEKWKKRTNFARTQEPGRENEKKKSLKEKVRHWSILLEGVRGSGEGKKRETSKNHPKYGPRIAGRPIIGQKKGKKRKGIANNSALPDKKQKGGEKQRIRKNGNRPTPQRSQ